ncbi:hypothetical protein ACFL2P_03930 [Candidatus Moduliflexota bacterium]
MRLVFIGVCAALILAAGIFFTRARSPQGERAGNDAKVTVSSDDVAKEVGEAVETTKDYLLQKKDDFLSRFDERMEASEEKIDELRRGISEAGEAGRVKMEEHLEVLRQKEAEVRRRYGELKESGTALREEAGQKLDTALRELEDAYGRAKDSFGSREEGEK